jgi:exopolyphosphatase/guanosine-5'-triphosphate,3'-diphosphate pyrophosphatase
MKKTILTVIDCGTNTFHIVIVEVLGKDSWKVLYRNRTFVYLADESVDFISKSAYQRANDTMLLFASKIKEFNVHKLRAIGTSALRTAENANQLISEIFERTGIQIEVIDGAEEARLIGIGVTKYLEGDLNQYLIMDIGGGSVEFILPGKPLWSLSLPIGVSKLYNQFHNSEPIQSVARVQMEEYIREKAIDVWEEVKKRKPTVLVGAAGTFDVVENMFRKLFLHHKHQIDQAHFMKLYHEIVPLNLDERLAHHAVPEYRARMIVAVLVLVDVVFRNTKCTDLLVAPGDIKDGLIIELI